MGIARALRRVKRQAQGGGLGALRSGLGEELRSGAIPGPLRGAARRIAAIIDPQARTAYKPGSTATPVVERAPTETLRHAPPAQANKLGSDRGDAPVPPEAPSDDDAVDPISVGATPVYDATPTEVAPIDATPASVVSDVTPVVVADAQSISDAAPTPAVVLDSPPDEPMRESVLEVSDAELVEIEAPAIEPAAAPKPQPKGKGKAKKKNGKNGAGPKSTPAPEAKEKLAASTGEATPAARSSTKAKRSGGDGGKTSKKK